MLFRESLLFKRIVARGHLPLSEISPDDVPLKGLLILEAVRIDTVVTGNSLNEWYRAYLPTAKGKRLYHEYRETRARFWMNSIIVPILVAIVTAFITVYILPSVGKRAEAWLGKSSQQTEQSAPVSSALDAPSETPQESHTATPPETH